MKKTYNIKGMHCKSCAKLIESELQDKVKGISVDFETGKAVIDFDDKKIKEQQIKEIINHMNYQLN